MRISFRSLDSTTARIVRGWHPALIHSFKRYVLSDERRSLRVKSGHADADPYWLRIPGWVMGANRGRRNTNQRFLSEILGGQLCAFLGLKIQDDILDGHVRDRSLILACDCLFLSAREAFEPYFPPDSKFWQYFASSLRRTINAIVETDKCQRIGYGSRSAVARLAGEGYAGCNIAAYAACLRSRRTHLFRSLVRCTDELAFVGQLIDDFEDMEEDLQRGRVNYAMWFLLGESVNRRRNIRQRLAREIIVHGRADRFFRMLQSHLLRAGTIAGTIRMPELEDYVSTYRKSLEGLETLLHRQRVQTIFRIAAD
jgi:hypothetical protein